MQILVKTHLTEVFEDFLSQIPRTSCLDLDMNGIDLNSFSLLQLVLGEPFQVLESTLVFAFFFGILEILGYLQ